MTDFPNERPQLRGSEGIKGFFDRSTASFHKESGSEFYLLSLVLTNAAKLFFFDKRLPARTGVHKTHFGKMKKSGCPTEQCELPDPGDSPIHEQKQRAGYLGSS
jgi:hypothetical protein